MGGCAAAGGWRGAKTFAPALGCIGTIFDGTFEPDPVPTPWLGASASRGGDTHLSGGVGCS